MHVTRRLCPYRSAAPTLPDEKLSSVHNLWIYPERRSTSLILLLPSVLSLAFPLSKHLVVKTYTKDVSGTWSQLN